LLYLVGSCFFNTTLSVIDKIRYTPFYENNSI
jgi:hypothetical protein